LTRRYGLGVKQARVRVDAAPGPIITGIAKVQAEALKVEIEALGAIVALREAGWR